MTKENKPIQVMASSVAPVSNVEGLIGDDDLDQLKLLLQDEEESLKELGRITLVWDRLKDQHRRATEARDSFCTNLRNKYAPHALNKSWKVDFEKKVIVVD
jgi:hypothetical protein